MVRAENWSRQPQLEQHDPDFGTYMIHHAFAIEAFIDTPTPESGSSPAR
jgi:hypothetical protein